MSFNPTQASSIVNELYKQATGDQSLRNINTKDFVSVAEATLRTGYDNVLNAISVVLSRTIFSVRPYKRKFNGLYADEQQFGLIARKLNIADSEFEDGEFDLPEDGTAVDHYKIKRANILQMNFYGANNYELQSPSIFKNQLDQAFNDEQSLVDFWAMITQNAYDMIEQAHETLARATISNYIGGKIAADSAGIESGSIIHALTEYNTATGESFTSTTIKKPANYPAFMQWLYGRIAGASAMMTERSNEFHTNVTNKSIKRHTPRELQKVYLLSQNMYEMDARVLADKYHVNFLDYSDYEAVNYWQSIGTPAKIMVSPSYLKKDGTIGIRQATDAVTGVYQLILSGSVATDEKVTVAGVESTCGSTQTTAAMATIIAGKTYSDYTASASGSTITFTEKSTKEGAGVPVVSTDSETLVLTTATTTEGKAANTAIEQDNIFGVIVDAETLGYTMINEWVGVTPLNAKGGYTNIFYHFTDRYWTDFTENGIVILLD